MFKRTLNSKAAIGNPTATYLLILLIFLNTVYTFVITERIQGSMELVALQ